MWIVWSVPHWFLCLCLCWADLGVSVSRKRHTCLCNPLWWMLCTQCVYFFVFVTVFPIEHKSLWSVLRSQRTSTSTQKQSVRLALCPQKCTDLSRNTHVKKQLFLRNHWSLIWKDQENLAKVCVRSFKLSLQSRLRVTVFFSVPFSMLRVNLYIPFSQSTTHPYP